MKRETPHFLLLSEAVDGVAGHRDTVAAPHHRWRFVLEATDGSTMIEAEDDECDDDRERLELLALVRGLEALDQPSHVTLVTSSLYVSQGLRFGLEDWRDNAWQWEKFGEFVPIKNGDLWRRVDQALRYHRVDCRIWRIDQAHRSDGVYDVENGGGSRQLTDQDLDRRQHGVSVKAPHFSVRRRMAPRPDLDGVQSNAWYERHPELAATQPRSSRSRRPSPLRHRGKARSTPSGRRAQSMARDVWRTVQQRMASASEWLERLMRRWSSGERA